MSTGSSSPNTNSTTSSSRTFSSFFCFGNKMVFRSDSKAYVTSTGTSTPDINNSYLSDFTDSSLSSVSDCRLEMPVGVHTDSMDSIDDIVAESTTKREFMVYKNTHELSNDLRFVLSMPEMCDVTFLVGANKVEVHGVKAILATRCRAFYRMFITHEKEISTNAPSTQSKFKRQLLKLRRRSKTSAAETLRKNKCSRLRIPIPEFDVATFKRLLVFLHCGSVNVTTESVIGLMNAAEMFGVEDLEKACHDFSTRCLSVHTALQLLHNAEPYAARGTTRKYIEKILTFIDGKGEEILTNRDFETISKRNARAILLRKSLSVHESMKWDAALRWSRKYYQRCDPRELRKAMKTFIMNIRLEKLSPETLMCEVQPLGIVSDCSIHAAVASRRRQVIGRERDETMSFRSNTRPMMGVKAASLRVTPKATRGSSRFDLSSYSIRHRYACDSDSGFTSSESFIAGIYRDDQL